MRDLHTTTDMRFVLLVCFLTWPGRTSADEPGFVTVAEGDDAVLPCSFSSKENIAQMTFDWKKDGEDPKQVFYYLIGRHYNNGLQGQDDQFKGRVSHFQDELKVGNASIEIQRTKLADNGSYTCIFPDKQTSHITLYVGAAPKPYVKSIYDTNERNLLQCEVQGVPQPTVEWRDSAGNILPAKEPKIRKNKGRSYVTLHVVVTKTDNYTCVATQQTIYHQINSTLYFPVQGAVTSVTILGVTEDGTLLQCEVQGASPKSDVVWLDHAGNIIPSHRPQITERGGSYDVILLTTVTKTDYYNCTTTQENTEHQVSAQIYVPVTVSGTSTPWIICGVLGTVLLLVFITGAVLYVHLKQKYKTGTTSENAHLNGTSPSG